MLIFLLMVLISVLIYLIATNVFHSQKEIDNNEQDDRIRKLILEYEKILEDTNNEILDNYKTITSLKNKIKYKLKQ